MSDDETIEVGHVMKEPEVEDLENKNITKEVGYFLKQEKRDSGVEWRIRLMGNSK